MSSGMESEWLIWGKTSPRDAVGERRVHPLLCHMIDVAVVAQALWDEVLPPAFRARIAAEVGLPEEEAGRWVALLAGLHDLGKASPVFQSLDPQLYALLPAAGFPCPDRKDMPKVRHGTVSARVLPALLRDLGLASRLAHSVGAVVGGHHGTFPTSVQTNAPMPSAVGTGPWDAVRQGLARQLVQLLQVGQPPQGQLGSAAHMLLAGLTSVADWIGSIESGFPYVLLEGAPVPARSWSSYVKDARQHAATTLARLGWTGWRPSQASLTFSELFTGIPDANDTQRRVQELANCLDSQSLVLIEAPMGEGKTEAAFFLADRWGSSLGQRGFYVALPTQATSNQMFSRTRAFLSARYPTEVVHLQLLHGHALLSAEFETLKANADVLLAPQHVEADSGHSNSEAAVIAAGWFTYRKRGLLAPFGVGTVDQGLMAALQTKHVFVRLFGLAHKVVILDEVHAYDAYMTTLLERLLMWLGALGSSVVLLSATLPAARRQKLLDAFRCGLGEPPVEDPKPAPYPRISWATSTALGSVQVQASARSIKEIELRWMDGQAPVDGEGSDGFPLGKTLCETLADGGCAAVICNTVARAQAVYRALQRYFPARAEDGEPELQLLHARFLVEERQRREKWALVRFGKPGEAVQLAADGSPTPVRRPRRAVLVATQVIEQSLDLDFDLMVTDVAPIDLLLQRSGRLHRHTGLPGRTRLDTLGHPSLWLCEPEAIKDGVPFFGRGNERVYAPHVLLRSWLALRHEQTLTVPDQVEALIEDVYDDARQCPEELSEALRQYWDKTRGQLEKKRKDYEARAKNVAFPPPTNPEEILESPNLQLEEDNPSLHESLQALTRLSEPTVSVVFLGPAHASWGTGRTPPTMERTKALLQRSLTVSHFEVVPLLVREDAPRGWQESALLRHHRLVRLDANGEAPRGDYRLRLDPDVGLVITKKGEGAS